MNYRQLGGSGLKVPELTLGTGTFGGGNEFFKSWGTTGVAEATRLVDICLEAGANMFDSADVYSDGQAYEAEFVALDGHTKAVATLEASQVRAVTGRDMAHARPMQVV